MTHQLNAQTYKIDYTFERSHHSRIEQKGKFGLIDEKKNILIPAIYDKVNDFYNGFAKVVKDRKVGFVNIKAEEVIPCTYEEDTTMITGAVVEHVIDASSQQESIVVGIDERREGFSEEIVCVIRNGKYGFVDKGNKTVIPFQFDGADNFYDGVVIVKEKDKYGVIDKAGKTVIPIIYDLLVWDFSSDPILYNKKDGQSFLIDKKGKQK